MSNELPDDREKDGPATGTAPGAQALLTGAIPATTTRPSRPASLAKNTLLSPLFIIIVLLVAWTGAGGYLIWNEQKALKAQLTDQDNRLAAQAEATRQETARLAEQLERAESQLSNVITSDLEELQTQQQTIEALLDTLRDKVERNAQSWATTEVVYLLRLANDRLHLDGDLLTTLAALESADQRLQDFDDSSLFEVRRLLTGEITALRAIPKPDITGIALKLGALSDGVEHLPFPHSPGTSTAAPSAGAGEGWRGVMHDLWQALRQLVVIKHKDQAEQALLNPDERYFLQQNLRLSLESARTAALRHNTTLFHDNLRRARDWIALYYDRDAAPTQTALNELTRMQEITLSPALPDISGSLRALQAWQLQRRGKTSGRAAP